MLCFSIPESLVLLKQLLSNFHLINNFYLLLINLYSFLHAYSAGPISIKTHTQQMEQNFALVAYNVMIYTPRAIGYCIMPK